MDFRIAKKKKLFVMFSILPYLSANEMLTFSTNQKLRCAVLLLLAVNVTFAFVITF